MNATSPDFLDLGELDGPVLIFGGPYSNLHATKALKAEAEKLGIPADRVLCTGDVVAYAAAPDATTELILDFNDKYQETDDLDTLNTDLSKVGEWLATRFELKIA